MNKVANFPINLATRQVAILGFDGIAALDLIGPLEALSIAHFPGARGEALPCYRPIVLGLEQRSFTSESGLVFRAEAIAQSAPSFDTILIPGGRGLRQPETIRLAGQWLAARAKSTRRIASVSTGIYALAQSGLVDGRAVTTHWRFSREVARRFPKLRINPTASFLKDDQFYTSAGGKAGMEMAIYLIREDYGTEVALAVARELVVDLRPPGDADPLVQQLDYVPGPADRVAGLPVWIASHLTHDLSVEALAERTALCRRHFSRLFQSVFNHSPADFVEQMRLSEARRRLLMPHHSVESAGLSVGYRSAEAFRRAFERRFGSTPNHYRRRFRFRVANTPAVLSAAHADLVSQRSVRAA
jgi:transcriptional regulator GlxA family with amidase domain